MSPTNRTFRKKPAKTLSEEKSREFPHSLGSEPPFAALGLDDRVADLAADRTLRAKVRFALIVLKNSATPKSSQKLRTLFSQIGPWKTAFAEWWIAGTMFRQIRHV